METVVEAVINANVVALFCVFASHPHRVPGLMG
jgi:hypothetical protein